MLIRPATSASEIVSRCRNSIIITDYSYYCTMVYQVAGEIRQLKAELKKKRSLLQMDELKCRKRVLRRMGYATASDVIELKGRVACEISR